jgi:hypothetical protein
MIIVSRVPAGAERRSDEATIFLHDADGQDISTGGADGPRFKVWSLTK